MDNNRYVVFIGGPILDHYFLLDSWPAQGDKAKTEYLGKLCGGMIGNAARNCASLGIKSYCFDVVDTDENGELIMQVLKKDHVDVSHIVRQHLENPFTTIVMVSNGERNVFLPSDRPQHNLQLTQNQRQLFYGAEYVYSELLVNWLVADDFAFQRDLKAHGVKLVFDLEVTMSTENWYDRVACANIVFTNQFGVEHFRGGQSVEAFAQKLFSEGVEKFVITLGAKGCRVITPANDFAAPAYAVDVVDTTGAGDTFNSTFLACCMKGMTDREAAAYANAAASMAVTRHGPDTGVTTMPAIERFLQAHHT